MCGMCLPHCPTYQLSRDEGESPRGRIALIQGMVKGRLALSERLESHLDHCLGCRACEAVCPSGVAYGEIIDGGRAVIQEQRKTAAPPFLNLLAIRRWRLRLLGRALRLYQRSGMQKLARAAGAARIATLGRLDAMLPKLEQQTPWRDYYPPLGEQRGTVAMFLGCFAAIADRSTLNAAIHLLARVGYGVRIPAAQACCGALHLHRGDVPTSRSLARRNAAAFNSLKVDAVITTSSGCGVTLAEYSRYNHPALDAPVRDINEFLSVLPWPSGITPAPLAKRVAVHDPCSLNHVLHQAQAPYQLLARIPDIELRQLPDNSRCCGAAGSYMLTQPDIAARLRKDKIAALHTSGAEILVTSNLGCALHLRAGLLAAGLDIEITHPVTLLARQLQLAG